MAEGEFKECYNWTGRKDRNRRLCPELQCYFTKRRREIRKRMHLTSSSLHCFRTAWRPDAFCWTMFTKEIIRLKWLNLRHSRHLLIFYRHNIIGRVSCICSVSIRKSFLSACRARFSCKYSVTEMSWQIHNMYCCHGNVRWQQDSV